MTGYDKYLIILLLRAVDMRYSDLFEDEKQSIKKEIKDILDDVSDPGVIKGIVKSIIDKFSSKKSEPEEPDNNIPQDELPLGRAKKTEAAKSPLLEDVSSLKEKLYKMIEKINDPIELDSIYSIVKKDVLVEKCRQYYINKFGSTGRGQDRWFANLILNTKSTFEEKEDFIDGLIQNDGLFDGGRLLQQKEGSFDQIIGSTSSIYDQIKNEILKHRGQLGFGPDQGPMEIFLCLFGEGIGLATKGDLNIKGKIVELKASSKSSGGKGGVVGGRPVATSGYGTPAGVKQTFLNKLVEFGADKETIDTIPVNLNPKGFENINKILSDNGVKPKQTRELIDIIFKGLYPNMSDAYISKMYKSITPDGRIDVAQFMKIHAIVQIMYYKDIEGFDYLLIANSDSTNYVLIADERDAEALYGRYKLSALINWNESRGGTAATQLIVY